MNPRARLPLVLVIFDGWGIAPPGPGNAIAQARTPVMDSVVKRYPHAALAASGSAVGLPKNQEGNSEAGHINIGAGRVIEQDSVRISKGINDGSFFKNAAFRAAIHHVQKYRSQLHLMGLLTEEQSGHADPDHLIALLTLARMTQTAPVALHLFTDGRDSPPRAALSLLRSLERVLRPNEFMATIMGRFYAMDRRKEWSRTKRAYEALVFGTGRHAADADDAVREAYERGETDEFIAPTVVGSRRMHRIRTHDSLIFFNFRSDRARQLTKVFVQKRFSSANPGAFKRVGLPSNLLFVAMTDFGPDLGDIYTAFPSVDLYNTLPVVLRKYRQLYLAETEKYAHVSFFFNGGYDKPVVGEDRIAVPSPNVPSYDAQPQMSAQKIAQCVADDLAKGTHDVIMVNFANPDMVGHTGNLRATVQAIETVDRCLGTIADAVRSRNGTLVVTADHGNAEEMIAPDGKSIDTEHTTNPVPFVIVTPTPLKVRLRSGGRLADVSPTILDLLGIEKPAAMTGTSLIEGRYAA